MIVAGVCLVVITIIIPWGVFTRYVLGFGSSWPEPMAVLLMIWFSFMAAAICYRENLHIGVAILPNALTGWQALVLGWLVEILMAATNLFMLVYGHQAGADDLVPGRSPISRSSPPACPICRCRSAAPSSCSSSSSGYGAERSSGRLTTPRSAASRVE